MTDSEILGFILQHFTDFGHFVCFCLGVISGILYWKVFVK